MPAISFSTLKDKILSGEKTQTIRPARTDYWFRFKKGDPVYGYWKMRTKECTKLFEGVLIENPFLVYLGDFDDELMIRDGCKSLNDGMENWFLPHYGERPEFDYFVVLRWEVTQISQQLRKTSVLRGESAEPHDNGEADTHPVPAASGREKEEKT